MKIRIILEAEVRTKDDANLLTEKAGRAAKEAGAETKATVSRAGWSLRRDRTPDKTEEGDGNP